VRRERRGGHDIGHEARRLELPPEAQTAIVADTHPLSLDSLGRIVAQLGIELSARDTKIERVADLVEERDPDLLVLGVDAVDVEVEQLLRVVQRTHPKVRVVVISDNDPPSAQRAFAAGVHAYCDRTASADDLAAAIRQSFERSIHLRPLLAGPATPQTDHAESQYLTRREVEILRLVAEGHTNKHIAGTLWITVHTVKFHLSNIYPKLNVANRAEATRWAERHGLETRSQAPAAKRKR
jgi:DNA-binding NarL/FixJ family response regulator